ncbi:uncharacterized protein LOC109826654 [Asparagus officinalis]|uniref:uncharacterized protein LOC109826654 n=1 Tax=Asparagus officinalis TaxID=4686 RepID=UPI00098E7DFF|nr:uncharacterized protein LOC109826654 [Asparagus officinalis]
MSRVEYSASNEEHNIEDNTGEFDGTHDDNGPTQKKRGRGYDKPKWGKSGKESIAFTEDGLCVDPKDAQLSRYLGSLAKNSRFLPLKPIDWRLHDDTTMDHVWKTIYDTIDWRPEDVPNIPKIRLVMLQRLSDRCRNYKASLKAKYYTPYVGLPERFLCGDDRVDRDQWRAMVNYWDTDPKNKVRCEKNIESRKRQKMNHTGGTKSFARHMADYEKKHGRKPDPIEIFYIVHKRRDENKSWIDDASEELAVKISRELTSLVETHGEETSELRQQAYVAARGLETRSPSQQHSPSQHTPTSYPYPPYHHLPLYPYTSSSQFYYPHPYQPPLYHPVPHPPGEFTAMLNDSDFMQQMMPPNDRNDKDKS